jgi:hypothetical protein
MKWEFILAMVTLTVLLAVINHYFYPIHLLIVLAPIFIGTIITISKTLFQIVILIAIWIVLYIFIISRGIF